MARTNPTTVRSQAGFGWIPDLPDQRDHLYGAFYGIPKKLPAKVDLRPLCPAIEDQGQLGSCTANALAGALELLERKAIPRRQPVDLSRLFIYYDERVIEHSVGEDSGAMLRDGIKTLAKQGACPEPLWPYDIGKFRRRPAKRCYTQAARHTIASYQRLGTIDEMRACLADGFPFVFGFSVYASFMTPAVARSGTVPLPKADEKLLGGHAVCAVGYDQEARRFTLRNSWGTQWGRKGYFTMPYDYLANRSLSDDFWTVRQFIPLAPARVRGRR